LDFERVMKATPLTCEPVDIRHLQEVASAMVAKCTAQNNPVLLKALPPTVIRLSDLGKDLEFSYRKGLNEVHGRRLDIIISSDSLFNCFTTEWGGETLMINGRFQVPTEGNVRRFFRMFRVPRHNSFGSAVNLRFLGRQVIKKVRSEWAN